MMDISIHAPREGSDAPLQRKPPSPWHFYPRSPRGERHLRSQLLAGVVRNFYPRSPRGERPPFIRALDISKRFLSTFPARGATADPSRRPPGWPYFYPRSPRGERLVAAGRLTKAQVAFLSTLPARGATRPSASCGDPIVISIHAPREGSDKSHWLALRTNRNFYPRSPRGERREAE